MFMELSIGNFFWASWMTLNSNQAPYFSIIERSDVSKYDGGGLKLKTACWCNTWTLPKLRSVILLRFIWLGGGTSEWCVTSYENDKCLKSKSSLSRQFKSLILLILLIKSTLFLHKHNAVEFLFIDQKTSRMDIYIIYLTITSGLGPPPCPGLTMHEDQLSKTSLHSPTTHSLEQNSECPGE